MTMIYALKPHAEGPLKTNRSFFCRFPSCLSRSFHQSEYRFRYLLTTFLGKIVLQVEGLSNSKDSCKIAV